MEFDVREATPADADAVHRVARDAWHAAHEDALGAAAVERAIAEWYDPETLAASTQREDGRFLVASADGEVVGFAQAVLGEADEPADLARIYVAPHRWGEGVGTVLLERIERWLREQEVDRLRLAVVADNEVGNAFYEKHGYAVVEEREQELFGATFDDYVREKEL
ncbi:MULTISPECIES: GNAT family N-acetyltransferase [Halorussus]|uniref:GNAT family N-acetyltransferase n=1 Tax=Halorussus TaxID=1070314 RepID=UPI00209E62D9|nr:GNAT family N-acetyltransferase [Halorussus vallis]USZ74602.1 GNAT family N-acetyltransferase [Halorussus vallis]